jgi:hypothetical protein
VHVVVRSPLASIVQVHRAEVGRHAHLGVAPHPAGKAVQVYVLPRARVIFTQYSPSCLQKIVPHWNVPAGGWQPLAGPTSTPPALASQSFR